MCETDCMQITKLTLVEMNLRKPIATFRHLIAHLQLQFLRSPKTCGSNTETCAQRLRAGEPLRHQRRPLGAGGVL